MPIVTVATWEGKTPEQKRRVIAAITVALEEHFGASPGKTVIIFQDVPRSSWGHGGLLSSDASPE
jgi:4-oxalocrotonate tautomerase